MISVAEFKGAAAPLALSPHPPARGGCYSERHYSKKIKLAGDGGSGFTLTL